MQLQFNWRRHTRSRSFSSKITPEANLQHQKEEFNPKEMKETYTISSKHSSKSSRKTKGTTSRRQPSNISQYLQVQPSSCQYQYDADDEFSMSPVPLPARYAPTYAVPNLEVDEDEDDELVYLEPLPIMRYDTYMDEDSDAKEFEDDDQFDLEPIPIPRTDSMQSIVVEEAELELYESIAVGISLDGVNFLVDPSWTQEEKAVQQLLIAKILQCEDPLEDLTFDYDIEDSRSSTCSADSYDELNFTAEDDRMLFVMLEEIGYGTPNVYQTLTDLIRRSPAPHFRRSVLRLCSPKDLERRSNYLINLVSRELFV
ncbi:hypothetical protein HK102_009975 [Quaeritorhiza haematococci]|nr:hypothetical protein HK102_009975 [Quaeritorhiza haematococci]